jgi:hypothetical protein
MHARSYWVATGLNAEVLVVCPTFSCGCSGTTRYLQCGLEHRWFEYKSHWTLVQKKSIPHQTTIKKISIVVISVHRNKNFSAQIRLRSTIKKISIEDLMGDQIVKPKIQHVWHAIPRASPQISIWAIRKRSRIRHTSYIRERSPHLLWRFQFWHINLMSEWSMTKEQPIPSAAIEKFWNCYPESSSGNLHWQESLFVTK